MSCAKDPAKAVAKEAAEMKEAELVTTITTRYRY